MQSLIVYYSRGGQNLVNGSIRRLKVGNTELVATVLQKYTKADLFRIEPYEDYPDDYYRCIDLARQDLLRNRHPALKNYPDTIKEYDAIYLGFPNYWGTMPMPVFSFLEHYDFTGKVIRPFCTYESSRWGHSLDDLRKVCPTARIDEGLALFSSQIKNELFMIEEWACGQQVALQK